MTAFLIWIVAVLPAAAQPRRVVVLYDERTDLPGLAILDASLSQSLTSGAAGAVEVYRESMDLSRFNSDGYVRLFRDHLRAKYAAKKIDVVVAAMGPSLDFLLGEGAQVFPGAPIVFCGIDRREIERRSLPSHVTGVLLKREFSPTLEAALLLHPDTTRVVFVGGTSEFDARLVEQAREEFRSFEDRITFSYLTTLPLREMLAEVANLPPRTLVLYSTLFRDGAGDAFVPHEVAERLNAASSRPVYGFLDQFLGRGIVGGQLYSLTTHGQQAAGLARQVLDGKQPSELPLIEGAAGAYLFDWRQIRRWRIDERRLPPGSLVQFRELSTWKRHQSTIIAIIAVLTIQAALIATLLVERGIRRRAQTTLREHETMLRTTSEHVRDLAGQLITAQEAERARIARDLHDDIGQRIAGLSIAISSLKRLAEAQSSSNLLEGLGALQDRTLGLSEDVRHISHDLHPGILRHVGLMAALSSHCREFAQQHGIPVVVTGKSDLGTVDDTTALCFYRVTQEVLRNIAKHASASRVDVSLDRSGDELVLTIADDGKGFDLERTRQRGAGLGLRSIDERVRIMLGRVHIESAPGRGTRVEVRLGADSGSATGS